MAALRADPRIGTEIAGYRIEAPLGRGGMSVVYLAEDLRLHRKVALKLIAPELAQDERFRDRFLAESELAASLDHPNVVPIYEAGEAEGVLFIAMRYVEGADLKELLANGALPPERAIALCAQVAGALDAAHARGLVHRDVKPSNVLIDAGANDHVYLADFGLTRRLTEEGARFASGLSLGTPSYVAPEQIRSEPLDGRADLYSLGCLLYECLGGEPPFQRPSDASVLFAHLEEEPPSLHGRDSEFPEAIDTVIARALAKLPDDRYGSCRELVGAAREALGIGGIVRWRTSLLAGLIGAVLLAAGLLAFFLVRGDGTPLPPTSGDSLIRIDPETNEVAATIPVGKNPSAIAVGASGVWVANRDDGTVSRIDPATNEVELEATAHGAPADISVSSTHVIVTNGPAEAGIAVIDPATGAEEDVFSLAAGSFFGSPSVAAGESQVWVATGDRRVGRLNVVSGTLVDPVVIPQLPDERADEVFSGVAVSQDGIWVAGDPLDRTVWRIDTSTGELVATIPLPFPPKDVAAGAGGVWVTSQLDDTVSRIDPATNEVAVTIPVGKGAAGVAVGAGSVWVANAVEGTVSRIDPQTLRVETIDVEGNPDDVAVGGDAVWVTVHGPGVETRDDEIAIGVLAACEGSFGNFAPAIFAGAELPLLKRGAMLAGSKPIDGVEGATVAGKSVELFFGCGDDSAEKALSEARRLVEVVGVDVLIGPQFIGESFAIRDYARRQPAVTFVSGIVLGQAVTLTDPAPNFFRFATDAAQQQAGLGEYAYDELGWRRVVTIGDQRSFSYTQTAGFVAEFCALGGMIVKQIWVPLGAQDLSPYTAEVPPDGVDGFFVAALPPTVPAVLEELPQLEGNLADRLIGGGLLFILETALGERLDGVVFAAPDDLDSPAALDFRSEFGEAFPELASSWAFFPVLYYGSMEAVLEALEAVDGDLSDGQRRFQAALAEIELDIPTLGHIRLDERRQAIGPNYLVQFQQDEKGALIYKTIRTIENVEQTFNGYFKPGDPPPGKDTIECKHGNPPPWTR